MGDDIKNLTLKIYYINENEFDNNGDPLRTKPITIMFGEPDPPPPDKKYVVEIEDNYDGEDGPERPMEI